MSKMQPARGDTVIQHLTYDEFIEFSRARDRYLQLYPDKVDPYSYSACVNVSHAITDINALIPAYESAEFGISEYVHLVVLVYGLMSCFDHLSNQFTTWKYDHLYGKPDERDGEARLSERQKIDYFRMLRALTTAHPLLQKCQAVYSKFNITEGTCLEDIRLAKEDINRIRPEPYSGDVLLDIRSPKSTEFSDWRPVSVEQDIIAVARLVLSKFPQLTTRVNKKISDREHVLRNEKIGLPQEINTEWLSRLKEAVLKRYPREIEHIEGASFDSSGNEAPAEPYDHWVIQGIYDFVEWQPDFGDDRDDKTGAYQAIQIKRLHQYAASIQTMSLNDTAPYRLDAGLKQDDLDGYALGKIQSNLPHSTTLVDVPRVNHWESNYATAKASDDVTDAIWGAIQLKRLEPALSDHFKFDWSGRTYKEMYWQFLVALFARSTRSPKALTSLNPNENWPTSTPTDSTQAWRQ